MSLLHWIWFLFTTLSNRYKPGDIFKKKIIDWCRLVSSKSEPRLLWPFLGFRTQRVKRDLITKSLLFVCLSPGCISWTVITRKLKLSGMMYYCCRYNNIKIQKTRYRTLRAWVWLALSQFIFLLMSHWAIKHHPCFYKIIYLQIS